MVPAMPQCQGWSQAETRSDVICALPCSQVLTRLLHSSSPILYWFSAHLLQEYEPLLWSEGTDDQTSAPCYEECLRGKSPGSCANPVVGLLLNCRSITLLSRCILGFFLSYWLLGLVLHCNFLPWT